MARPETLLELAQQIAVLTAAVLFVSVAALAIFVDSIFEPFRREEKPWR